MAAGCGGSSSLNQSHSSTTVQAQQTPAQSNPDSGTAKKKHTSKSKQHHATGAQPNTSAGSTTTQASTGGSQGSTGGGQSHTTATTQKASGTPAEPTGHHSSTSIPGFNPCTLVSVHEAQTITGGGVVSSSEVPLGPTCLYHGSHSKAPITLTLEAGSYTKISQRLGKRTDMVIGGHQAACGRLGRPMLFVRVAKGRILNVTAPCPTARKFATVAVGRLTA